MSHILALPLCQSSRRFKLDAKKLGTKKELLCYIKFIAAYLKEAKTKCCFRLEMRFNELHRIYQNNAIRQLNTCVKPSQLLHRHLLKRRPEAMKTSRRCMNFRRSLIFYSLPQYPIKILKRCDARAYRYTLSIRRLDYSICQQAAAVPLYTVIIHYRVLLYTHIMLP